MKRSNRPTVAHYAMAIAATTLFPNVMPTSRSSAIEPGVCPAVEIRWKRTKTAGNRSDIELVVENHSCSRILLVHTERPNRFFLSTTDIESGLPFDGFSFTGRTYQISPIGLPRMDILDVAPGGVGEVACPCASHAKSFVVEIGLVADSDPQRFQRTKELDGSRRYYEHDGFLVDIEAVEVWIRDGENSGSKRVLVD